MALIDCPECGTQVSSAAAACPKCAYPIAQEVQKAPSKAEQPAGSAPSARARLSKRDKRVLLGFLVVFLALGVIAVLQGDNKPKVAATVEPGSQSRNWGQSGPNASRGWTRAGQALSATPVVDDAPAATTDERTIRNPEATFGKNRAAIQSLCERSGGGWIDGMCILPYGYGIAFEWRNGRVYEHTILKDDPDFGRRMVREFRKLGGEEDTTVPEAGCKEWIWRNISGRRYWVCPGRGMSSASARKLR